MGVLPRLPRGILEHDDSAHVRKDGGEIQKKKKEKAKDSTQFIPW